MICNTQNYIGYSLQKNTEMIVSKNRSNDIILIDIDTYIDRYETWIDR